VKLLTACPGVWAVQVFVGMLVGANVWGWLADLKGRRVGFLYPGLFSCVAGVASAAAPNFTWLLLCRALVGLGLGGVPVAFNLFLEFLPLAGRGQYLVLFETFWAVGAVVEAGLAWAVFEPLGWCVNPSPLLYKLESIRAGHLSPLSARLQSSPVANFTRPYFRRAAAAKR